MTYVHNRPEDFARYHPVGSLGRKLGRVEDQMRTGRHVRTARPEDWPKPSINASVPSRTESRALTSCNQE